MFGRATIRLGLTHILVMIIIRPHRSTTYVDAAYCYLRSSVVCRSVTIVSPAQTTEPIEMSFGLWTRVGRGNHVLDGGPDPSMRKGDFEGKEEARCKVATFCRELCKSG